MAFFGANVAFIRSGQEGRATLGEGLVWGKYWGENLEIQMTWSEEQIWALKAQKFQWPCCSTACPHPTQ